MIREYYVRGKRKTVKQIDNVVAMNQSTDENGLAGVDVSDIGTIANVGDIGMPEDTATAFANAQWLFVEPLPETAFGLDANETLLGTEQVGALVQRLNGRFAVVTRRLNVQIDPGFSAADAEIILADRGLKLLTRLTFAPNLFEVDTVVHADALAASVDLNTDERFTLAEPSFTEHVPVRLTPTNPGIVVQWQWTNTSAEKAWKLTRGAGIRVAVIDNGFNPKHDDLHAGIGTNSGFFRSSGASPATFVQGTTDMPVRDHGTFCAGIVGARHNNAVGGCGAAPECELMLIACLSDQVGTQTTLARALSYAADPSKENGGDRAMGADIVVCSLGPDGEHWDRTDTLELAIKFAAKEGRCGRGVAIFWAASNGYSVDVMEDEVVSHADVIAVVRSTQDDRQDNVARGQEVELTAPGVDVVSTTSDGGYDTSTGNSFAAPCAAGCAALALAINQDLTRDQLRIIMRETADKVGGVDYDADGHNDEYGFGRVNAYNVVLRAIASRDQV